MQTLAMQQHIKPIHNQSLSDNVLLSMWHCSSPSHPPLQGSSWLLLCFPCASLCLSASVFVCLQANGPLQQVRMLTEMLESYEREIQSLEGSINEAEEDLDNTRWAEP